MMGIALAAMLQAGPPVTLQAPYARDRKLAGQMLAFHNRLRRDFGSIPMTWDVRLEAQATAYARRLAYLGRLVHAPRAQRPGQGENLAVGSSRYYRPEALAATWRAEQRYFRGGIFPDVSTTGNWASVGHYSQVVWPASTRLGCGTAVGRGLRILVCRYSPAGNRDGVPLLRR